METLISWITKYSPQVVFLLVLGASLVFAMREIFKKAISTGFDKHKEEVNLALKRKSNFKERLLLDQYELTKKLQEDIVNIGADLN